MDNPENKYGQITKIITENTGGNCILDFLYLDNGQVLVISDDCICLYTSEDDFENAIDPSQTINR